MAWTPLREDYTDAVWSGLKRYTQINNDDSTVSFQDVTVYTNKENSFFGALDANKMNQALNIIMAMVENGTDLYQAFQTYFATQETLFKNKADNEYELFKKYLTDMETEGFTSLTEIANRAEASATKAKTSENNAKTSEQNAAASATAAKASENKAKTAEESAQTAQGAAENAQAAAENASTRASQSAQAASDTLTRNQQVAVRTPYVGTNGHWYVWNNNTGSYEDSGTKAQGETGPQGIQGETGPQGPRGIDGVAVQAEGMFAFNVNEEGHLILSYTGDEVPDFTVNEQGHLIYNF